MTKQLLIHLLLILVLSHCTSVPTPNIKAKTKAVVGKQTIISNAYPELPEMEFKRTTVSLAEVQNYLNQTNYDRSVKISCYVIFKTESASGTMGINNNYIGYQADGSRVHEEWTRYFVGTVIRKESMTGKPRRFLAFSKWEDCIDILLMRIAERGLYVGGTTNKITTMKIESEDQWPLAYYREWVLGDKSATLPDDRKKYYLKAYRNGAALF